ncbi:hypothetical protein GQX74_011901 [Glossina fuscipes]|nr:hypothetical protein GQX74_011901 [Glossina fuscipes]
MNKILFRALLLTLVKENYADTIKPFLTVHRKAENSQESLIEAQRNSTKMRKVNQYITALNVFLHNYWIEHFTPTGEWRLVKLRGDNSLSHKPIIVEGFAGKNIADIPTVLHLSKANITTAAKGFKCTENMKEHSLKLVSRFKTIN